MKDSLPTADFRRRNFLKTLAAGAACAGLGCLPALAQASTPQEQYVKGIADDVMTLANGSVRGGALKSKFVSLLNRHSDVRGLALFSLGQYQKGLPSGLKTEYFKLVVDYAAGLFVYYIDDFAASDLDIRSSRSQGKAVIIDSSMRFKGGSKSPVKWRVVKAGGGYRVSDVNVRGIWLSLQMREKFVSVLRENKGDFDALLKFLRSNA